MDQKLCDEIVLAAADEIMFDAQARFDAWVATRDAVATRAKDPANAAAGELGVDFFQVLTQVIVSVASGVFTGVITEEVVRRLHKADPTLSDKELQAVGTVVEERLIKAGVVKIGDPPQT